MCFHVQILESQFLNLYHGLHMTRQGDMLPVASMSTRYGEIPDFEVEHVLDRSGGLASVCSPPPAQMNARMDESPIPKGKAHITIVKLCDVKEKEVAVVDSKGSRKLKRASVNIRENEADP